ncbi:hypothetical protein Tco_1441765 [Tanacetum coccineum]
MDNGKSVSVSLGAHFKVSLKDCPSNDWDVEKMSKVPYVNAVGSLLYLMVCTRLDIAYVVSIVSRYLANPCKNHWEAAKWILKYLKGTADVGLVYGRDQGKHVDVDGFVDADYAKDPDKGRSITGYHFIREIMESKEIEVAKIGTKDNAADAFTKEMVRGKVEFLREQITQRAGSGQKKAMVFYQMDTEEVSDRFVVPCFVNGLEAYDAEINLKVEDNMISNEYAVKLCLEH